MQNSDQCLFLPAEPYEVDAIGVRNSETVAFAGNLDVVWRRADGAIVTEVEFSLGLDDAGTGENRSS